MPKPEWGVKRTCLSCAARFYDLMRSPIYCPKCGAEFDVSAVARPKRPRPVKAGAASRAAVVAGDVDLLEEDEDLEDLDGKDEDEDDEADDLEVGEDTVLIDDTLDEDDDEKGDSVTGAVPVGEEDDDLDEFEDDALLDEDEDADDDLEGLEDVAPDDEEPV